MRVGVMRAWVDGVFFVGRERERGEDHSDKRERKSRAANGVDAFAACDRERNGERRIGGGDRAGDADGADFEGMIEREPRNSVDHASDGGEEPGRPTGSEAAREATGQPENNAERGEAEELHDDERAERADAARGEARGKIRHTPAESRRYSEDDIQG